MNSNGTTPALEIAVGSLAAWTVGGTPTGDALAGIAGSGAFAPVLSAALVWRGVAGESASSPRIESRRRG